MKILSLVTALLVLYTFPESSVAQVTSTDQLVVIAHTSVPIDSLEKGELLRLFSGDLEYWDSGDPVVIADLSKKGRVRESFYEYIGKTSSRMRSLWLRRKLSGEGELPEFFESEDDLLEMVLNTPGAIGYLRAETIMNVSEELKVLISGIPLVDSGE